MLQISGDYIPKPPRGYAANDPWPTPSQVIASIADISQARYPKFNSEILYPDSYALPSSLSIIEPVVSMAHPAIETMTGALIHPSEPSEFRNFTEFVLRKYSSVSKYVLAFYIASGYLNNLRTKTPSNIILASIAQTLRTTTFIVMTTASSWLGIAVAQSIFSNKFIPAFRYKLIGFMAGLWAFVDQAGGRGRYMYASRMALRSYWDVLVKQKKVRPIRNGDVYLFAVCFAVLMSVFEISPGSISGGSLRKVLNWVKSASYEDPIADQIEDDDTPLVE